MCTDIIMLAAKLHQKQLVLKLSTAMSIMLINWAVFAMLVVHILTWRSMLNYMSCQLWAFFQCLPAINDWVNRVWIVSFLALYILLRRTLHHTTGSQDYCQTKDVACYDSCDAAADHRARISAVYNIAKYHFVPSKPFSDCLCDGFSTID